MLSTLLPILVKRPRRKRSFRQTVKTLFLPVLLICALLLFLFISIGPSYMSRAQNDKVSLAHTSDTIDSTCTTPYYSKDGNPFQLCPGPFPGGGNCVWWAWEQWHLLGYDLPLNWGNAADWIVDAERAGLSVGTQPRAGAIAVFPRKDGVWAYSTDGHVAFVTSVSDDFSTFNVTYQNYGDSTPMYLGLNYPVQRINDSIFQQNQLRFIYFPTIIDPLRFSELKGINETAIAGLAVANTQEEAMSSAQGNTSNTSGTIPSSLSHPALGLPNGSGSTDQEFNADFTGNGLNSLLLYNRQQGSIGIMSLSPYKTPTPHIIRGGASDSNSTKSTAKIVLLSDAKTSQTGWGSTLDIRVGDFAGTGKSQILLYDRLSGAIQILTLTPQFKIKTDTTIAGWGPNWELYVGNFNGHSTGLFMYNRFANAATTATTSTALSTLQKWDANGRTASVLVLDFNKDLSIQHLQQYTQWHNSWEVYIGRFSSANKDGVFLYDRRVGEVRTMDFDSAMSINNYESMHGLTGNWQVFSGDFNNSGRAQVVLYEPSRGTGSFLELGSNLALVKRLNFTLKPNQVFYVGHFGTARLNAMLYDPQTATSTFVVFNNALQVSTQHTVHSWNQHYQILVGAFVDRSACVTIGNCSNGDDILVLNRQTGQIQQYAFNFGRKYQVINNRGSVRMPSEGSNVINTTQFKTIDTTVFQVLGTYSTSISGEEIY